MPSGYLYFRGKWGDQEYPDEAEGQEEFHGFRKWTGGPEGPLFKYLDREDVCWTSERECVIKTELDWAYAGKNRLAATGFLFAQSGWNRILNHFFKILGRLGNSQHLNKSRCGEVKWSCRTLLSSGQSYHLLRFIGVLKFSSSSRIMLLFRYILSLSASHLTMGVLDSSAFNPHGL